MVTKKEEKRNKIIAFLIALLFIGTAVAVGVTAVLGS